mgnify:FL=1
MKIGPIILCSLLIAYGAFVAGCSLEGTPERSAGNRSLDADKPPASDRQVAGQVAESPDRTAEEDSSPPAQTPAASTSETAQERGEEKNAKGKRSTASSPDTPSQSGSKTGKSSGGKTETGSQAEPMENLWTRKQGHDWPTFLGPTGDSKSKIGRAHV